MENGLKNLEKEKEVELIFRIKKKLLKIENLINYFIGIWDWALID